MEKIREVTIKDVAKDTKLAMSTISKYINSGNVKPKNCIIIKEAIERLGYQPNGLARGLRTSKMYTIGIMLPALSDLPLVVIDWVINEYELDYVLVDSSNGVYQEIKELVKKGHRKITIITGKSGYSTSDECLKRHKRVFEDYNMKIDKKYIIEGNYTYEGGYEAIKQLWNMDEKPTAVFVCNYQMCIGAVKAIYDLGISMPEVYKILIIEDETDIRNLISKSLENKGFETALVGDGIEGLCW